MTALGPNGQDKKPTQRPTVWLLHYKDQDRPAPLFMSDDPGEGIEWRSTKVIGDIQTGDPVLYWRDIKGPKDRGGLVGTGRFLGGLSRSQEDFDPSKKKTVTWHYYPTRFVEIFPRKPLSRDPLIKETGLKLNWGWGSILKVPPDIADRIDDYLVSHDRKRLFDEETPIVGTPQITFVADAPKTDEDLLRRADLAFVLAARLNRVWDEINREKEGTEKQGTDAESQDHAGIKAWVHYWKDQLHNWRSRFQRRRDPALEGGFVVHIDAPWGGGKTTFANYLARILDPYRTAGPVPKWLTNLPLGDDRFWPKRFRRPWYVVNFNAWQNQHVDPPWWCFYQAIRKQCFHAVRTGTFAAEPQRPDKTGQLGETDKAQIPPPPLSSDQLRGSFVRHCRWLALWRSELWWRVFNPKFRILIVTFILTWVAAIVLYRIGLFKPNALKGALGGSLSDLPAVLATGIVILLGGATAIWSIFATLTESLLPGTPSAAKNYSLGSGDPLERFRIRFDQMIRRLKEPVIVVVDDIDRCEPKFVVELLRGIQTILRSPRVIFVLLGDRDWIELAFANVHAAMEGIHVGPEHTFGGRFVEKAIQLSLVLPDILPDAKTDYVRTLLGVGSGVSEKGTEALPEGQRKAIEEEVRALLGTDDPLIRDDNTNRLRTSIHDNAALPEETRKSVVKQIDRTLALRSAADEKVQEATQHRLVPIASVLPANPRQVKRIINGIAFFQEIARIEQEVQPGSSEWRKLALWVVLMTEWPQTWVTLSTYPGLADHLHDPSGETTAGLPEEESRTVWVKAIKDNQPVMNLINFKAIDGWPATRIDSSTIERFRSFMPAVGGNLLPKPERDQRVDRPD